MREHNISFTIIGRDTNPKKLITIYYSNASENNGCNKSYHYKHQLLSVSMRISLKMIDMGPL